MKFEDPRHIEVLESLPLDTRPQFKDTCLAICKMGFPFVLSDSTNIMNNFILLWLLNLVHGHSTDEMAENLVMDTTLNLASYCTLPFIYVSYLRGPDLVSNYQTKKAAGQDTNESIDEIVTLYKNTLAISFTLTPIVMPFVYWSDKILLLSGESETVSNVVGTYLKPCTPLILIRALQISTESLVLGFNCTKAMWGETLNLCVSTLGALCFGLGWLGHPYGAAAVFFFLMFEASFAQCWYLYAIFYMTEFKELHLSTRMRQDTRRHLERYIPLLKEGLAITIPIAADVGFFFYLSAASGRLGAAERATLGLITPYLTAISIVSINLAFANRLMMGNKHQRELFLMALQGACSVCLIAMVIPTCIALTPSLWLDLFKDKADISQLLPSATRVVWPGILLDTTRTILGIHLRRKGQYMKETAMASLLGTSVSLVTAGLFGFYTSLRLNGLILGYALGGLAACMLLFRFWEKEFVPAHQRVLTGVRPQPNGRTAWCAWFHRQPEREVSELQEVRTLANLHPS